MFARRVNPFLFVAALLAVSAASTGLVAGEILDLKYVNADAIAALVIHPRELLTAPELELLPREVIIAACIENLGIDPGEIDEAVGLMAATGLPSGEPAIGAILRFTKPLDAKLLAEKLGRQTREVMQGGQTYQESTAKGGFGYAIVDERTLLLGTNLALKSMLAPDKADSPLRKLLAQRSTSKLAVLLVDVETIRPLLQLALKSLPPLPPEFQEFLQAPEMAKWAELSLELRSGFDLQLTLGANDADAARKLTLMGERLKTITRDMVLDAMRANLPRGDSPTDKALAQYMNRLLNRLVEMVVIKTEADQVHVTLEGENMPQMATSGVLVALLLPAVQAVREAARRNATMNNLRQIGVGMHEFAKAKREFPPRALTDPEGKPLLSCAWPSCPTWAKKNSTSGSASTNLGTARTIGPWSNRFPRSMPTRTWAPAAPPTIWRSWRRARCSSRRVACGCKTCATGCRTPCWSSKPTPIGPSCGRSRKTSKPT